MTNKHFRCFPKSFFYFYSIYTIIIKNYSIISYVSYNYHKYKRRIIKIETYTDEDFNSLVTDLVQAIRKQKLVIFVGAGVSISQGYPNWNDYVTHLIKYWQSYLLNIENVSIGREKYLVFDTISKSNLSNKRKVDLVNHAIKSILGDKKFKKNRLNFEKNYFEKLVPYQPSNEILEALVNIDAIFVTPNYDLEIEKHAQRLRNSVKTIHDLQDFVMNNDSKLEWGDILHIHGTPRCNPDFFVSSSADYSKTYLKENYNFNQLKKWFTTKNLTVLFVGVSLEEDEILSLLAPENKHYALMKSDESRDPKVDKEYRSLYSTFFKNENHTSIIWYGSSFDDLPKFIKKLTNKISEETGLSPQNREWQLLLNPISTEDEIINALNSNADNGTFLNDLYKKLLILNAKELSEHILHPTFKSNVVKNTVINNFDSFWNFVDQNKESLSLEEWKILKELFAKGNQNYYINSLYNLYKYGIDYQKISNDELVNIRSAIGTTASIPFTKFIKDCDLMGYWFINQFTPKDSKDTYNKSIYLTNDVKEKLKLNLNSSQITELINTVELSQEIIPYSIEELISEGGILEILYILLSKNHIFINEESLLEKIPEELISRKVIQKILVKLDNDISLESNLVEKLINNINFNDQIFGSELNSFVQRHSSELEEQQILPLDNYHELITGGASFIVRNNSFITVEQILNLSEQELLNILLTSQENQFNPKKPWEENTVNATIDFCIELLTNNSNKELQEKFWTFLSNNSKKLFNRYSSLFYKLAIIEELPKDIINFSISTCLENMNDYHFSHDKEKFFTYFVQQNNLNTQVINKLFSISPNNLDSSLSDNKDFDIILFFSSELGGYLSTLIELVIKHKEEYLTRIKKIIDNLSYNPYKQFMKGVFLYDYDVNTEEINYEIFLGYIYYHERMPNKTGELFANLVSNLLKTKINDNKALSYSLLIALEYIKPKEIMFQHNNLNYMVNLIFLSQKKFKYENDWLRQLILQENKSYNILSLLALIIQEDRLNNDKYLEFLETFKDNVTECTANIELYSLTYYLSEEKLNEEKTNLLIKYIWILLKNRKIGKSFQDLESLFILLPYLDSGQLISLKESQYIQELLSPLEWEELKRKIGNYINQID
ncbi:SIR2 family protein [Streptococcus gallolyticus]|uniref:SIR2 family protein n=1 Tax=Streptococcus gallolyticus TaxID=315405 RepID=UPI002283DF4A|nr:SIR2 family protein [Streptococcus gallolyticus]MCY7187833.1 SIR2 family protein [Streptococcus gallolyticus subsp. gallolyticus]